MQVCRYKLENSTLNSVLDCGLNKTNTKKDRLKGAEVVFGERYGLVIHCLHCSSILYTGMVWYNLYFIPSVHCSNMLLVSILWLFYIVRVYSIFQAEFFVIYFCISTANICRVL